MSSQPSKNRDSSNTDNIGSRKRRRPSPIAGDEGREQVSETNVQRLASSDDEEHTGEGEKPRAERHRLSSAAGDQGNTNPVSISHHTGQQHGEGTIDGGVDSSGRASAFAASSQDASGILPNASLPMLYPQPSANSAVGMPLYLRGAGAFSQSHLFPGGFPLQNTGQASPMGGNLNPLHHILHSSVVTGQQESSGFASVPPHSILAPFLFGAQFTGLFPHQMFSLISQNLAVTMAGGRPPSQQIAVNPSSIRASSNEDTNVQSGRNDEAGMAEANQRGVGANRADDENRFTLNRQGPGRRGPVLYLPCDDDILSDHQILLRKQIEFFEATAEDVETVTPGRRKEIVLGQVGIRCRHCATMPVHRRTKGAVYYPAQLKGLYQAAQNMAASHLSESCENIDPAIRAELREYHEGRSTSGHGGKQYWADGAKVLGVVETEECLRFSSDFVGE